MKYCHEVESTFPPSPFKQTWYTFIWTLFIPFYRFDISMLLHFLIIISRIITTSIITVVVIIFIAFLTISISLFLILSTFIVLVFIFLFYIFAQIRCFSVLHGAAEHCSKFTIKTLTLYHWWKFIVFHENFEQSLLFNLALWQSSFEEILLYFSLDD